MQPPVIFLIGPTQHGKSEARRHICALTGLNGGSCSDVIYHWLAKQKNVSVETLQAIPKETLRPELIRAGDFLCGTIATLEEIPPGSELDSDYRIPSLLVRTLYHNRRQIIDGVRRPLELRDAISHLTWNGVRTLTIWIQDPRKEVVQDNTHVTSADADEVVSNDGDTEELKAKLAAILEKHFPVSKVPAPPMPVLTKAEAQALAGAVA